MIIVRETLIEGELVGESLEDFFQTRSRFFLETHHISPQEYEDKVKSEFLKILSVPEGSVINLWFEDDLFCQANLWCALNIIFNVGIPYDLFLVRPPKHDRYGFGGLNEKGLFEAYENKIPIKELSQFSELWKAYQRDHNEDLISIARVLSDNHPYILPAVQAQLDRLPAEQKEGRPMESLKRIIHELKTDDFGMIFKEFSKRESIYGFGDLQVKKMYETLKKSGQDVS